MAGINLSQSLQEKQSQARGSFFDKGLYINVAILAACLLAWGGVHWYLTYLENRMSAIDDEAFAKIAALKNPDAVLVSDFRLRLDDVAANMAVETDPAHDFALLEQSTIPNVKLTSYAQDFNMHTLQVSGVTDNLKFVAQEMLSLKKNSEFKKVSVKNLAYDDTGKLKFTLIVDVAPVTPAS